jgi:hypothetical protein
MLGTCNELHRKEQTNNNYNQIQYLIFAALMYMPVDVGTEKIACSNKNHKPNVFRFIFGFIAASNASLSLCFAKSEMA